MAWNPTWNPAAARSSINELSCVCVYCASPVFCGSSLYGLISVAVRDLDLRPGGELVYEMTANGADQIEYMTQAGMPLLTVQRLTFEQVDPPRRLVYKDLADFIPGVEPYQVETVIELTEVEDGVRMVLTFDAMHDDHWTKMATLGRESELEKLAQLLAARQ